MTETEKQILELLESMQAEIKNISKQLLVMRRREKQRAKASGEEQAGAAAGRR